MIFCLFISVELKNLFEHFLQTKNMLPKEKLLQLKWSWKKSGQKFDEVENSIKLHHFKISDCKNDFKFISTNWKILRITTHSKFTCWKIHWIQTQIKKNSAKQF